MWREEGRENGRKTEEPSECISEGRSRWTMEGRCDVIPRRRIRIRWWWWWWSGRWCEERRMGGRWSREVGEGGAMKNSHL